LVSAVDGTASQDWHWGHIAGGIYFRGAAASTRITNPASAASARRWVVPRQCAIAVAELPPRAARAVPTQTCGCPPGRIRHGMAAAARAFIGISGPHTRSRRGAQTTHTCGMQHGGGRWLARSATIGERAQQCTGGGHDEGQAPTSELIGPPRNHIIHAMGPISIPNRPAFCGRSLRIHPINSTTLGSRRFTPGLPGLSARDGFDSVGRVAEMTSWVRFARIHNWAMQ